MSRFYALIEQLAARSPDVVALAEAVSLATLIDRPLLRRARLEQVPDGDAGTEADLWLGPLVERRSPEGFTLFPEAAEHLRHRFFARDRDAFEAAWQRTRLLHAHISPAVQAEEEIAYLATRGDAEAVARIEALLHSVIAAMVRGERRGLAHWAARALPTLPPRVRAMEQARMLAVGAHVRLHGDAATLAETDQPLPPWLAWIAPDDFPRVDVRVRLGGDAVEVDATGSPEGHLLRLPRTDPLLVELLWDERDDTGAWQTTTQAVPFAVGEMCRVHVARTSVRLRNVLGEVYDLRSVATPAGALRRQRIDFAAERARHRPFFGREDVIERLEAGLREGSVWMEVVGAPGSGKSALLAHMIDRLEERGVLVPHHFFGSRRTLPEDALAARRSLVAQIAARHPDLTGAALAEPSLLDVLKGYSEEVFARTAEPLVIVIDGGIPRFPGRDDGSELYLDPIAEQVPRGVTLITSVLDADEEDSVPWRTAVALPAPDRELVEYWRHHGGALGLTEEHVVRAALASEESFGVAELLLAWLRSDPRGVAEFLADTRPEATLSMLVGATLRGEMGPIIDAQLSPTDRALIGNFLGALAVAWAPTGREDVLFLLGDDPPHLQPASAALLADPPPNRTSSANADAGAMRTTYALRNEAVRAAVRSRLRDGAFDQERQRSAADDPLRGLRGRLAAAACAWRPGEGPPDGRISRYGLRYGIRHWIEAGEVERARTIATSVDYLALKSRDVGVDAARLDLLLVRQALTEGVQAASDPLLRNVLDLDSDTTARSSHPQVFISYASKDRPVAEDYARRLRDAGAEVLIDRDGLRSGDAWQAELQKWLANADVFLLLWSEAAARSEWVKQEWTIALRRQQTTGAALIHPIALDRTQPPDELRHLHFQFAEAIRPLSTDEQVRDLDMLLQALEDELPRARLFPAELPSLLYNRLVRKETDRDRIGTLLSLGAPPALRLRRVVGGDKSADRSTGDALVVRSHAGPVLGALPIDMDGRFVSWSADGTLKLWELDADAASATLYGTASAHAGGVSGCAGSTERLLSTGADGVVRIWEIGERFTLLRAQAGRHGPGLGACNIDSGRAACWYADGTIEVWDLSAMRVQHELAGAASPAGGCVADPAAGWLASGHNDGVVRVWDLLTGALRKELRGHSAAVTSLAARGGVLASASNDRTARVWSPGTTGNAFGEPMVYDGHEMAVTGCDVSRDGRFLATSSADGRLRVWDLSGDAPAILAGPVELSGHAASVLGCMFTADDPGTRYPEWVLLSWSADRTVRRWENGEPTRVFEGHTDTVRWVGVSNHPEGPVWLLTGSDDRTLRAWRADGSRAAVLDGRPDAARVLAPFHEGRAFVRFVDGALEVMMVAMIGVPDQEGSASTQRQAPRTEPGVFRDERIALDGSSPSGCLVAPGNVAIVWGVDGTFELVDLAAGKRATRRRAHDGPILAVAVGGGEPRSGGRPPAMVTGGIDHTAKVWGLPGLDEWMTLEHDGPVAAVAINAEGDRGVVGSWDATLTVWDVREQPQTHVLRGHTDRVLACCFARIDGSRSKEVVVSAGADRTIRIWDADNAMELRVLRGHEGDVTGLAAARNAGAASSLVVSWSLDRTLRVWDLASGAQRAVLRGHTDLITSAAMLDQRVLLSSGLDGTVRAWDVGLGVPLGVLRGSRPFVQLAPLRDVPDIHLAVALDEASDAWLFEYGEPSTNTGDAPTAPTNEWSEPDRTADGSAEEDFTDPPGGRRRFVVRGAVQGVGFRWWVRQELSALGLTGSAENQPDGTVVVELEGPPTTVERLREKLAEGPPSARVESVVEDRGPGVPDPRQSRR